MAVLKALVPSVTSHAPASADEDLRRRVLTYLHGRNVPSLRNLSVSVARGVVTLQGRVGTFYEKQLCCESIRRVAGVFELVDSVAVSYPRHGRQPVAGAR